MSIFTGELGLQFVTHLASHYTVPELIRLAEIAKDKGFCQLWFNDNIRYRNQFVVMAAVAARVPIRLGTAVMVPYFHNPLDVADSLGALSELRPNQEISIGIARGDLGQAPQHVQAIKPVAFVRETAEFLRRGLAEDAIPYAEFPTLSDFITSIAPASFNSPSSRKQVSNSTAAATARRRCACAAKSWTDCSARELTSRCSRPAACLA